MTAFVDSLPSRLEASLSPSHIAASTISILQADLNSHINTIQTSSQNISTKIDPNTLEKQATYLWNSAARLDRKPSTIVRIGKESKISDAVDAIVALVRVFAFMLIECSHRGRKAQNHGDTWEEHVKLLRAANKAAKSCIDSGQLDVCTAMLAKAVDIETSLGNIIQQMTRGKEYDVGATNEDERLYQRLRIEYFTLRIILVRIHCHAITTTERLTPAGVEAEQARCS